MRFEPRKVDLVIGFIFDYKFLSAMFNTRPGQIIQPIFNKEGIFLVHYINLVFHPRLASSSQFRIFADAVKCICLKKIDCCISHSRPVFN